MPASKVGIKMCNSQVHYLHFNSLSHLADFFYDIHWCSIFTCTCLYHIALRIKYQNSRINLTCVLFITYCNTKYEIDKTIFECLLIRSLDYFQNCLFIHTCTCMYLLTARLNGCKFLSPAYYQLHIKVLGYIALTFELNMKNKKLHFLN